MTWLTHAAKTFLQDEGGLSIVEYAILLALISIVGLAAISVVGTMLNSLFSAASSSI